MVREDWEVAWHFPEIANALRVFSSYWQRPRIEPGAWETRGGLDSGHLITDLDLSSKLGGWVPQPNHTGGIRGVVHDGKLSLCIVHVLHVRCKHLAITYRPGSLPHEGVRTVQRSVTLSRRCRSFKPAKVRLDA
jgi:hypothetical protein